MPRFSGKVKLAFREDLEPNEILLDRLARRKEEEGGLTEKKFETPLFRRVIEGLFVFSLLILLLLLAKTVQLQIFKNGEYLAQAEANKFIFYKIRAERGVIYDRNLKQLVFNEPNFGLILEKSKLPEEGPAKLSVLTEIAGILKVDFKELEKKVVEAKDYQVLISENLSNEALIVLETKLKDLPGFKVENNSRRQYVDGADFSQILGYSGKITSEELKNQAELYSISDYVGRTGVEKTYEEILRKNPGQVLVEKDARGNIISRETTDLPKAGQSLVLWLDSDLQKKIREVLENELRAVGSSRGAVVALDPRTGGMISLVSLPSFDNNIFSEGDSKAIAKVLSDPKEPLFNRVVSGQYPTGSSIKPLIASAALEEKVISPQKEIYNPGFIEIPHRYDPEITYKFLDQAAPGYYDVKKAIAFSSNVYFYTVGGGYGNQKGLGPTRIKSYLELFGWGKETGIGLPSEADGLLPSPEWKEEVIGEKWWDGDTYNMSIGQGNILATPLQVVSAFSAIANGGKLLEPRVVKEILGGERAEPEIIREDFISSKNLQVVREGMRQAVTSGSAVTLKNLPVEAAAKTGTAQTNRADYYHNWVTVFAPYDNPEIVLTVLIENVPGVQSAALPVAKEVLSFYFSRLNALDTLK